MTDPAAPASTGGRPATVRIGIITKNRRALLEACLQSVREQELSDGELLRTTVVDDGSTDGTLDLAAEFPEVEWMGNRAAEGYLIGRNRLMRTARERYYLSLDDDARFVSGDEVHLAIQYLEESPSVAAVAFDILSPDRPEVSARAKPIRTSTFIGCGHVLRCAAVETAGYYVENPGTYGGEEKDLSVRLLEAGSEIVLLPGVHVWHEKSIVSRDLRGQRISGVCNDLSFALRRCPMPALLLLLPMKLALHLKFAILNGDLAGTLRGVALFGSHLRRIWSVRRPVRMSTLRKFRRLSMSEPAS